MCCCAPTAPSFFVRKQPLLWSKVGTGKNTLPCLQQYGHKHLRHHLKTSLTYTLTSQIYRFDLLNCREASHNLIAVINNIPWYVNLPTLSKYNTGKIRTLTKTTVPKVSELHGYIKALGTLHSSMLSHSNWISKHQVRRGQVHIKAPHTKSTGIWHA